MEDLSYLYKFGVMQRFVCPTLLAANVSVTIVLLTLFIIPGAVLYAALISMAVLSCYYLITSESRSYGTKILLSTLLNLLCLLLFLHVL